MDEQYIYVDSKLGTTPNNYTVFLNSPIKQIKKVDLVSASVPYTGTDQYIFLDIEQFRSRYGTQSCRANTGTDTSQFVMGYMGHLFCARSTILQTNSNVVVGATGNTVTNYSYSNVINYVERQYTCAVTFKQPIESIDKLNIRWVDKFNNLVNFTNDHSFVLRVHTIRMELDDYTPLMRPPPVHRDPVRDDIHMYLIFAALIIGICVVLMLRGNSGTPVDS